MIKYFGYMMALQILWPIFSRAWADVATPSSVLSQVYQNNSNLKSMMAKNKSEGALISVNSALANPKMGIMRENSPVGSTPGMGPMYSFSIAQEFMWPARYGLMRDMQKSKTEAGQEDWHNERLKMRKEALSAYYEVYASSKILALLKAQTETLHEIAKITEVRRGAGQAPQQDEMKAHVEETKIAMELILKEQEIVAMKAKLNELMNRDQRCPIEISEDERPIPKLNVSSEKLTPLALENSRMIKSDKAMLKDADYSLQLAKTSYFPEFMLSFKKPFSGDYDPKNYTIELQMSLPVWFVSKESAQVSQAAHQKQQAQEKVTQAERTAEKEVKILSSQIDALYKLLTIYHSALIPQATSTLNASRSSYSIGRVGFQDLLDAERMLYNEHIEYYRNYVKLVENLLNLEAVLGVSVSDLPFDGGAKA